MTKRRINEWPHWPDARSWIGIGVFSLTVMILWMVKEDPTLRANEFFKNISILIVGTGFINGVVSWAYSATKGGGEAAESNARIAEAAKAPDAPQSVVVTNADEDAIPVVSKEPKK